MLAPSSLRTLVALRRHHRCSKEAVEAFRAWRLRSLIQHAYARVPYYRRLFDEAGLAPDDVRVPEDLRHVPITTRATIAELPIEELVARGTDPERLRLSSSAGSTGEPVTVGRTWVEARLLSTIRARSLRELGQRRGDRVAVLKTLTTKDQQDGTLVGRVLAPLRKDAWQVVDSGQPSETNVSDLAALHATILCGYPAQLVRLAWDVEPARLQALGLRFIATGGEVLTADQRAQIGRAFGVPVRDTYGSTEFDLLASECPQGHGYHVSDDGLILDVVADGKPAAPGECGEVVGTCLHAFSMPFIRYAQGDVVRRGESQCACGSPFSTIRDIQGRVVDFFVLPDDTRVHPYEVFVPIRRRNSWIRRFQVTQYSKQHVVMRVLPEGSPSPEQLERVRAMFAEHFGTGVRLDIELVTGFDGNTAGKFRVYRSHVEAPRPSHP